MTSPINLKSAFARLPLRPSPEEVERLASAVVACAQVCVQPRKSVAATMRHHVDTNDNLTPRVRTMVREAVDAAMIAAAGSTRPSKQLEPLLTLVDAAVCYGLPVPSFRERMRDWEFRRALGWPRHDGREWRFNPIVFNPHESAALFASLPTHEPWPPPVGYEAQPGSEAA